MCIGAPLSDFFGFPWFRTHPPLEARMERLLGPAAKRLLKERRARAEAAALAAQGGAAIEAFASPLYAKTSPAGSSAGAAAAALIGSIGNPSSGHMDRARRLLEEIPAELRTACGNESGAKAVIFALLLGEGEARLARLSLVREDSGAEVAAQCALFADALKPFGPRLRLPVLDLALPTLKVLPLDKRERQLRLVRELIEVDRKVTLGEFVLLTLLRRHLQTAPRGAPPVKHRDVLSVAAECAVVLSLLAHAGAGGRLAYEKGMQALGLKEGIFHAPAELRFDLVERALYELKLLAPLKKPSFIKACVAAATADDRLTLAERELLRAICAALDSPVPPILETAEIA